MSIHLHEENAELRGSIDEPLWMSDRTRIHSVQLNMLPSGELQIIRRNSVDFDTREPIFTILPRGAILMRHYRQREFGGKLPQSSCTIEDGVAADFLFKLYEKLNKQRLEYSLDGWLDKASVSGLLETLSHLHRSVERNAAKASLTVASQ